MYATARPLWNALRRSFGSLAVLRTHERLFPNILQDVVILLADDYGSHSDTVHYQAFERVQNLLDAKPVVTENLAIDALVRGERVFIGALLGKPLRDLLKTRIAEVSVPARKLVTFNIGYVTGDKTFFHLRKFRGNSTLSPRQAFVPTLTSRARDEGAGLKTGTLASSSEERLFLPILLPSLRGRRII